MRGTAARREQGIADPVLASMVHDMGLETAPHYAAATPKIQAYRDSWVILARLPEKSDCRHEIVEAVGGSPSTDFPKL
jgi:hypothetical protein